jgi:hypothetical protein
MFHQNPRITNNRNATYIHLTKNVFTLQVGELNISTNRAQITQTNFLPSTLLDIAKEIYNAR